MSYDNYERYPFNIVICNGQIIGRCEWATSVDVGSLKPGTLWRARSGMWYRIASSSSGNLLEIIYEAPEEAKALLLLSGDPL